MSQISARRRNCLRQVRATNVVAMGLLLVAEILTLLAGLLIALLRMS